MRQKDRKDLQRYRGRKHFPAWNQIYKIHEYDLCRCNGESKTPIMGCYGIGVGRLAASVCEAHHDEYGPIWPKAIAPWQVHLCAVRVDDEEVRAYADKLYEDLQNAGIEVIYDDRSVRAGVMFADADLLGIPLRIIVSPKNMKQGVVEVASRDKTLKTQIPLENVMEEIKQYL